MHPSGSSRATAQVASAVLPVGTDPGEIRVYFLFDRAGGWPPVPSEGLRATAVDGGYRVDETPFFVRNVALGDVVSAAADDDGVLWAGERVSWGGHQTVRVTTHGADGSLSLADVLVQFAALGATGDDLEEYALVALDVPPQTDPVRLHRYLVAGREAGRWEFEEACVSQAWPQHTPPR